MFTLHKLSFLLLVAAYLQESLCSLRFAAKVNQCETAAKGGAQRNVSTGAAALEWGGAGMLVSA